MTKTIKRVSLKMVREQNVRYCTDTVTNKNSIQPIAEKFLRDSAIERFLLVGMDNTNRPTVIHVFDGDVNQCVTAPATIFKILLLSNSVSFIVAHNHPADTLTGSSMDIKLSRKLRESADLLDLKLLDSIIYNSDCSDCTSLRDTNYVEIWD